MLLVRLTEAVLLLGALRRKPQRAHGQAVLITCRAGLSAESLPCAAASVGEKLLRLLVARSGEVRVRQECTDRETLRAFHEWVSVGIARVTHAFTQAGLWIVEPAFRHPPRNVLIRCSADTVILA
eukprot:2858500-Rhodomonas_salina.1